MRHGKKFNHLSRQTGHRKAMLANMACSLIEHKRINTTVAKAKALNIHLIFVPACHTGELQPLDYGIFGPLKNICKKNYDPLTHPLEYVNCFQSSFYNLDPLIIQRAFKESLALGDIVFDQDVIHQYELIDNSVKSIEEIIMSIDQ